MLGCIQDPAILVKWFLRRKFFKILLYLCLCKNSPPSLPIVTPQYSWVHKLIKLESILEVSVFLAKWYFLNKLNFCSLNDDLSMTAFGPSCVKIVFWFCRRWKCEKFKTAAPKMTTTMTTTRQTLGKFWSENLTLAQVT